MSYEDYISVFGNVIEHCSLCAAATWRDRPFTDVDSLHKSFCQFADMLPIGGKLTETTNQCV
jgi:2-oxo-4-hydroxy-4-carboxy--5-ureidoimidazoline (OHCU) decarboxylase